MPCLLLCDDNPIFLESARRIINTCADGMGRMQIYEACCMEEIPEEIVPELDIVLLDVAFPGKPYSGMDIARKLRKVNPEFILIFLTGFVEFAPEGYELRAFRYLLKGEVSPKLPVYLRDAYAELEKHRKSIVVTTAREKVAVPIDTICFIEAQNHACVLHLRDAFGKNSQLTVFTSLSALESKMEDYGFLRTQKSFLVNPRHIERFMCSGMSLDDGTTLPVSVKKYKEQKERYLQWKGRQRWASF